MKDYQRELIRAIAIQPGKPESLSSELVPGGKLTLEGALKVYANGYVARLTEALGETFEGAWWVLGDSDFFAACRSYIEKTPSVSYNLSDFGARFPGFLKSWRSSEAPYLSELACFEWLFHEVFHSAPSEPFDHSELHLLHERSDVTLAFQKHLRLFSSPYSVYELWTHRGDDPTEAGPIDWDQPEHLFIFKQDQAIFVQKLEPSVFLVLELLVQGATLDAAVDKTAMLFGGLTEEQISEFFADLIKAGVIAGIK